MNSTTVQKIGLTNHVNLCGSCCHVQPTCDSDNLIFGDGVGDDNIVACSGYEAITLRHPKDGGQEL